jgi:hypothetical protein
MKQCIRKHQKLPWTWTESLSMMDSCGSKNKPRVAQNSGIQLGVHVPPGVSVDILGGK